MSRNTSIALLAVLAALVFVHRVWVEAPREHGFESYDNSAYFFPSAVYLHDSLREGRLPLWNPYQLAGQPFVALHVPGALYPPNLLLIGMLPPAMALAALTMLHLWIAGASSWMFAARLGLGAPASAAAAAGYMLCGSLVSGVYNPTYLATMAWLPALLWAIHGLCNSNARPRYCLALAVALTLSFLGGHSQGFVYSLHLALPYGLFALFAVAERGHRIRVLILAAVAGILAAGFVAPQALPTLELQQQAVRSLEGHSLPVATLASYTPTRILRGLLGQPAPMIPEHPTGPLRWATAWPLLGLPLLLFGFSSRSLRTHCFFFTLAAIAAAFFVMGRHTSFYSVYFALPFGDLFRSPMRFSFVYSFCVAIGIAIGVEAVAQRLRGSGRAGAIAVPTALAVVLAIDLYSRSALVATHPTLEAGGEESSTELVQRLANSPGRERVLVGPFRKGGASPLTTKSGMVHRFFAVPDYEPAIPEAYRRYFEQPDPAWHGELGAKKTPRLPTLVRQLDMMSVRYYLAPSDGAIGDLRNAAGGRGIETDGAILFDHEGALPRAYAVSRVVVEPDPDRATQKILAQNFQPKREAVVDAIDPKGLGAALVASPANPKREVPQIRTHRVSIASYQPEKVVLDAQCAQPCLVVLTDLFYPGWRAFIEGEEQRVHRVNTLYRGVVVPAGSHRVTYRFEPQPFYIGVAIACTTLLVAIAACLVAVRRSSKQLRPGPLATRSLSSSD